MAVKILTLIGFFWVSIFMPMPVAAEVVPADAVAVKQWIESSLDSQSVSQLPYSFVCGGRPSGEVLAAWTTERSKRELDSQREQYTLVHTDPRTGLVVRCEATVYRDFPAVEWVLSFENTGLADTPILEDLQALHTVLGTQDDVGPCTLHYAEGSHAQITDFQPRTKTLELGEAVELAAFGGRSSDGTLPFFNLARPGGGGAVIGVGWTGQWAASMRRSGRGVEVRAGMEVTHLRLHPGEVIRTPAVLLLFWTGPDRWRSQNMLRQLLLRHYTPTRDGQPVDPPTAASPHAVVSFEDTTEANMLEGIANIAAHRLAVDYWWIDAGWFTCGRNWARYVGNPDPDPVRFPRGLRSVADAAHGAGLKFLLWFEPERVMPDTWLFQHHPEWLLRPADDMPAELRYQITDGFHLLDLGNPAALAWVKEKTSTMIGSLGMDAYRNDFNMYPLYYWRNGEASDRQGMREIKYVTGLYDYFDSLHEQHPELLIDTCASGGRRIDFEMLRRALVLTRSDYLWDPIGQQCHTYGLAQWVPITGIGAASVDRYQCRSGLGSHFVLAANYFARDPADWQAIAGVFAEHKLLKHLFTGDFYPLASYSTAADAWMAWQFHRADLNQGVVQVFRREQSPVVMATYRLCGLDAGARYTLTDLDSRQTCTLSGEELMASGHEFHIASQPGAAVITYCKLSP